MKRFVGVFSVAAIMAISGAASAASHTEADLSYPIQSELQKVVSMQQGSEKHAGENLVIDHNPLSYQKQSMGNHVIESWVEDGTAYTKDNGSITRAYKINEELRSVPSNQQRSDNYVEKILDANPSCYQKKSIAGHTIESWMAVYMVYTKDNGSIIKTYKINGDIEQVSNMQQGSMNRDRVMVDHNPREITETNIGNQHVMGWVENNTAYSKHVK